MWGVGMEEGREGRSSEKARFVEEEKDNMLEGTDVLWCKPVVGCLCQMVAHVEQ